MGAKQSKRSVDISGKEAESAGEVAAGAGGEGRVEQLADADALKPQLNGDAHIHETSEKEIDSGTPENEKDATTEKENKEQEDEKDKESSVITNGDSEQKAENGESTPSPEDAKKPKKEKVKKKWSLRSISFSRKDKPKQEKKQKEEEAKTNGEPEKVPEEVAEISPEKETNGVIQEDKSEIDKDEKTPETPVTEPITNGSSTPETPQEQTPIADEPTDVTKENERTESSKDEAILEQLPINGLPLEEPKIETAEPVETVASTAEETNVEKSESIPATESPDKKEVCVERSPLIEPSPPPLPANPPPSSVASFAATTMAPELTEASLANPAEVTSNTTQVDVPETNAETKVEPASIDIQISQTILVPDLATITENTEVQQTIVVSKSDLDVNDKKAPISISITHVINPVAQETVSIDIPQENINPENNVSTDTAFDITIQVQSSNTEQKLPEIMVNEQPEHTVVFDNDKDSTNTKDEIKQLEPIEKDISLATTKTDLENGLTESNDAIKEIIQKDELKEEIKNKMKDVTQTVDVVECNGRLEDEKVMMNGSATPVIDEATDSVPVITPEDSMPPSLSDASGDAPSAADSLPPPPSELGDAPQELISASDKMADLIPEVPSIPELKTELETTTDVAVAN